MAIMSKGLKVLLSLVALAATSYIYMISFHRVTDLEDMKAVVDTLSLPLVSDRCRAYNTSHLRCLPNVLFIGSSKCGTTSLVDYLSHHPNVQFVNRRIHNDDKHREVHRFDRNTYPWALAAIDLADEWASSPVVPSFDTTVIHYTPHYFYAPTVPFEVKKFYPNAEELRFIVMVREPVSRALSSYWFHNSHLLLPQDRGSIEEFLDLARGELATRQQFESCMSSELMQGQRTLGFRDMPPGESRIQIQSYLALLFNCTRECDLHIATARKLPPVEERKNHNYYRYPHYSGCGCDFHSELLKNYLYPALKVCFAGTGGMHSSNMGHRHISKGIYIDQVARWYANFRPDQFLFLSLEEFSAHPKASFQRVLDFLKVVPSNIVLKRESQDVLKGAEGQRIKGFVLDNDSGRSNYRTSNTASAPASASAAAATTTTTAGTIDPLVESINFNERRLEKPNKLTSRNMTAEQWSQLELFYQPYNRLLSSVIGRDVGF